MNADLGKLVELQRVDSELRRLESALSEIPKRKAEHEAQAAQERAKLDELRAALDQSQKARRQHEGELQTLEAKRSKYKGQLMDVKTNKEYTAMLHEIEGVGREIAAGEDAILAEMERAETLAAEARREEGIYKEAEALVRRELKALDEQTRRLSEQIDGLKRERETAAGGISAGAMELFTRIARLRGSAVCEARDEACQGCRVKLRLQMFLELRHNEAIVQCPSCNRILYYESPPPTVVPAEL